MQRRRFLGGIGAGAVGWVVGGAGRVPDVYAAPVTFGAAGAPIRVDAARTAAAQATTFPQSVASGDPNPNGAVIWTRVDPGAVSGDGAALQWQVAADAGFANVLLAGSVAVLASNDNTVNLPIANTALSPFTLYYYRFVLAGVSSRTGRFKTLPAPGDSVSQLNIGLANCQDYSNGFYTAHRFLAQENVDVILFLGDYIYEYLNDGVGGPGNGPVRVVPPYPSGAQYPASLADYRHLYQTYRADPDLQAVHENFAFISLWDDHEFYNDCHGDYHPDTEPAGVTPTTPQPVLRAMANQAWSEYSLAAVPFQGNLPWNSDITVYRSFQFGTLAKIVVTDERLYRDGPPCGNGQIGQRYVTTGCAAQGNANRTMLGATQKSWFINQMTKSTAMWNIWANEVMLAQYKYGVFDTPAAVFFDIDAWDGYQAERRDILKQLHQGRTRNFVALSGDAHLFMSSYLKTDFNSFFASPVGVEFLVGPISSGNYADATYGFLGQPAASSVPQAARMLTQLAGAQPQDVLAPVVLTSNPHMTYWNGSQWGYGVVNVTAKSLVCNFRAVTSVKQDSASVFNLGSFTVPQGKVKIN